MPAKIKLKKVKSNGKMKLSSAAKDRCAKFLLKAKLGMYLKRGLDIKDATKLCGVTDYQLGMLRSDPEFEEFIEFCAADCESDHLENIEYAGSSGQWQASAWVLERKFPDKYGKKDTIKHEYEVKLFSFRQVILNIINELDPPVRQIIMQKLRAVNVESELHQIEFGDTNATVDMGGK